jgi:lipopolysaccharide export system protein LptA
MKTKIGILFGVLFFCVSKIVSQETAQVEILWSDEAILEFVENNPVKRLIGHVKLRHKGTLFFCDKANIYHTNNVDAEGSIRIVRPSGTTITGNFLYYYSDQKLALIRENVVLTDKKSKLYTPDMTYDMNIETAYFTNGGKVINDSTTITSKHGTYYPKTNQAFFKFDVQLTNPKYKLKSDTLEYNTKQKRNYFYQATTIENDSGYIFCNRGWYDEVTNQSSFGRGTIIYNPPQWIMTDSIFYDKNNEFSRIYKTFEYHDTATKVHIFGDTADYYSKEKHILAYKRPLLVYETDNKNPLLVRAEILESKELDGKKYFYGHKKVRIYNKDFQGVCDSFDYNAQDSLMRMRVKPVSWLVDKAQIMQLTGEVIYMKLKNKNLEKVYVNENGLIVQEEFKNYYNQISADTINIYMKDKKMDYMHAIKNAKSIYFAKEEPKGYLGLNNSESYRLKALFDDGKLSKIIFYEQPKATFYPTKDINLQNSRLTNFQWLIDQRPKDEKDL